MGVQEDRINAKIRLMNISGNDKGTDFKNVKPKDSTALLREWEATLKETDANMINSLKERDEAKARRNLDEINTIQEAIERGYNASVQNPGSFGLGVVDALSYGAIPNRWYTNADNQNAVNAGKVVGDIGGLAIPMGSILKLGGKGLKALPIASKALKLSKTADNSSDIIKLAQRLQEGKGIEKGLKTLNKRAVKNALSNVDDTTKESVEVVLKKIIDNDKTSVKTLAEAKKLLEIAKASKATSLSASPEIVPSLGEIIMSASGFAHIPGVYSASSKIFDPSKDKSSFNPFNRQELMPAMLMPQMP